MMKISLLCSLFLLASCDRPSETLVPEKPSVKDSTSAPPLRFITDDYIELEKIERISKFRSGIGHDYSDDAESCRSMKHYYQPKMTTEWSAVKIFSPASGIVVRTFDEWAGTQVHIRPLVSSAHTIILFHVSLLRPLSEGDTIASGAQIGTHIGAQTMSDIALFRSEGTGRFALSYFDVMHDSVFSRYIQRGVSSRTDVVIAAAARDADPLHCSGVSFGTSGTLENWFSLK